MDCGIHCGFACARIVLQALRLPGGRLGDFKAAVRAEAFCFHQGGQAGVRAEALCSHQGRQAGVFAEDFKAGVHAEALCFHRTHQSAWPARAQIGTCPPSGPAGPAG